jgi:acyl carrier protein
MDNREVNKTVLTILAGAARKPDLDFQERMDLSSIQILNVLSQVEKQFKIEIEDDYVFHGLFSSADILASYINYKLELSTDENWRRAIDNCAYPRQGAGPANL